MAETRITNHAIERYIERAKENNYKTLLVVRWELQEMLKKAVYEQPLEYNESMRPSDARQDGYEYLVYGGWRFVVSNRVLVSVQRRFREQI